MTKNESDKIYYMKAVAIMFVVCAHCSHIPSEANYISQITSNFIGTLGCMGVPLFLFLSGYVFRWKKIKEFTHQKLINTVYPWFVCGTVVYFYVYLRKGDVGLNSYLNWIFGTNGYLWYMTVQIIIWCIAEIIYTISRKNRVLSMTLIGLISILVLLLEDGIGIRIHPYIDPFRWFWIFALGCVAREKNLLNGKYEMKFDFFYVYIILLGILTICGMKQITYWDKGFMVLVAVLLMMVISHRNRFEKILDFGIFIGKKSFSVYLLHMPIAGIVVNILNRVNDKTGMLVLIRPLLILGITMSLISVFEYVIRKINKSECILMAIGIR